MNRIELFFEYTIDSRVAALIVILNNITVQSRYQNTTVRGFFFFIHIHIYSERNSDECIDFTICVVFFFRLRSVNNFSTRNPTPIFKYSNFSERISALVGALKVRFFSFVVVSQIIRKKKKTDIFTTLTRKRNM